MPDIYHMHNQLSSRVDRLEQDRGLIAADISALRSEVRTNQTWIKDALSRIEDKLDERPSRAEMHVLKPAPLRKSLFPRIEVDVKNKRLALTNVSGWLVLALALIVGGLVAVWLRR